MDNILVFLAPFAITLIITPLIRQVSIKSKVVDTPGPRKIHKKAIPLMGGAAIYIGLLVGLLCNFKNLLFILPIFIFATIILIIGLIDDIRGLSAKVRLICQAIIALVVISFGLRVSFLPNNLWGDIGEVIITLIWIIGVTNAYNYLDGIDGLAIGSAVINLFCFAVILYGTGQNYLGMFATMLLCACLGFLPYNIKNAKIFLGDAGSTFLGFCLACIALFGSWAEDNVVKLAIPILILGVPIFDMVFTTIMRIKEKKVKNLPEWLKYAGKDHFHHYLIDLGLHQTGALFFIYFVTLALGISGIMVSNDNAVEAILTLSQSFIIFGVIATLIVLGRRHRRLS